MKTTKLIATVTALSLVFAGTAKVSMNDVSLSSTKGNVDLVVESNQDVYGLQFDLKYDPTQLTLNGAEATINDVTFDYAENTPGLVRGLMFSMQGKQLNLDNISSFVNFDFSPAQGFEGKATVSFDDVILAGENGTKISAASSSVVVDTNNMLPIKTSLNASYPNPFNPSTTINYDLAADGYVSILVYDALGREVATLFGGDQVAGTNHQVTWNAADQSSGAYFLRMTAGNYTNTQKLMLVK
jgi:hypothetical protein|tara:strand:- start:8919 stop:9644 length:726 start_codon:yes stop_codon:yes gene_type:complete